MMKIFLFISLCILRDLPQQKISRKLSGGGDLAIFLCSHVPMERFFDATDQGNSKTEGGKGQCNFGNSCENFKIISELLLRA
jgi:hypothetical protein